MIRETFKKSKYSPIEKINDNTYRLMWDKVDVMDTEYQINEDGSRSIISQTETDYCKCVHETIVLPKNMTNILEMINYAKSIGYNEPSMSEWAAWIEVFNGTLNFLKERMKHIINNYDSSSEVNQFYINNSPIWLDKNTRAGLKLRFESELASRKTDTILWYNGTSFNLQLDKAIQMLYAIELYASECYDNTQKHLANIDSISSIEEIINYNYKINYPQKLNF